jgi:hypothetical protein
VPKKGPKRFIRLGPDSVHYSKDGVRGNLINLCLNNDFMNKTKFYLQFLIIFNFR